jgi:hypothetical protein
MPLRDGAIIDAVYRHMSQEQEGFMAGQGATLSDAIIQSI